MYNFAKQYINKIFSQIKEQQKGFVVILIAIFIPVIILGVRYVVQFSKLKNSELYQPPANSTQNNANQMKKVALDVAKKFNPGNTLDNQSSLITQFAKESLAKYAAASIADNAIPGLGEQVLSTIQQKETYYNYSFSTTTHNQYIALNKILLLLNNTKQLSACDKILDTVINDNNSNTNKTFHIIANELYQNIFSNLPDGISFSKGPKYKEESYQTTLDNALNLKVSLDNDKIKVTLNDEISATAIPAQCNADLIITIPTNAAASNYNSQDSSASPNAKPTSISSGTTISNDYKNTPIYQIKQAYKEFIKQFLYTQGLFIAIIPYSAKISLLPENISRTQKYPPFKIPNSITNNFSISKATILGTNSSNNHKLTDNNYTWNTDLTGCPIMFPFEQSISINDNYIPKANILNLDNSNNKFIQMNLIPPTLNDISCISMTVTNNPIPYKPNPFPIIELSNNTAFLYDYINTYNPILDQYNNSNFIFLPILWTYNLLQNWTQDPKITSSPNNLSSPSKLNPNRTKALILIVNKPDFFDHGELTFLGMDNDLAPIPTQEADKINFNLNHADPNNKDAFGKPFNGNIQSNKRIISLIHNANATWNGSHYNFKDGSYNIKVPKPALIVLTVEPAESVVGEVGMLDFKQVGSVGSAGWDSACALGSDLFTLKNNGTIAKSSDNGATWTQAGSTATNGMPMGSWYSICAAGSYLFAINWSGSVAKSSDNGATWTQAGSAATNGTCEAICALGSDLFALDKNGTVAKSSDNGATWTKAGSTITNGMPTDYWFGICALGSYLFALNRNGPIAKSSDNGATWTKAGSTATNGMPTDYWYGICALGSYLFAINNDGTIAKSSDNGATWTATNGMPTYCWYSICAAGSYLFAINYNGSVARASLEVQPGSITFTNVSGNSAPQEISTKQQIFIQPNQLSGNDTNGYSVAFNMTNIKLISAEITNRPYDVTQITPPKDDSIDFSKNPATSKNGIIKFSGNATYNTTSKYYECKNGSASISGIPDGADLSITVQKTDALPKLHFTELAPMEENGTLACYAGGSWNCITFHNGKFYALSNNGTVCESSDNGATWQPISYRETNSLSTIAKSWCSLCKTEFGFFATTSNGIVAKSADGISWTKVVDLKFTIVRSIKQIDNSIIVFDMWTNKQSESTDGGLTWHPRDNGNLYECTEGGYVVTFEKTTDNNLLAISRYSHVAKSTDGYIGKSWATATLGKAYNARNRNMSIALAQTERCVFILAEDGALYSMQNGSIKWQIVDVNYLANISKSNDWTSIAYGNNTCLLLSGEGCVVELTTYPATTNWRYAKIDDGSLNKIYPDGWHFCRKYFGGTDNKQYIALNTKGKIAASKDGISWGPIFDFTYIEGQPWIALYYTESIFQIAKSYINIINSNATTLKTQYSQVTKSTDSSLHNIQNNHWVSIADLSYSHSLYIALNENGTTALRIGASGNWAITNSLEFIKNNEWKSLIRSNTEYTDITALNANGAIAHSVAQYSNNITWSNKNSNLASITGKTSGWNAITKRTNDFIALNDNGMLCASSDCTAWTNIANLSSISPNGWKSIACLNNSSSCIILHDNGTVVQLSEPDFTYKFKIKCTAKEQNMLNMTNFGCKSIIQIGDAYLFLHNGRIYKSYDLRSCTRVDDNSLRHLVFWAPENWCSIIQVNNKIIAHHDGGYVAESTDNGASWRTVYNNNLIAIADSWWEKMYKTDTGLIALNISSSIIAESTNDGVSWTKINDNSFNPANGRWRDICKIGTKFIALNNVGHIAESTNNCVSWTRIDDKSLEAMEYYWSNLYKTDTGLIAFSDKAKVATSPNGISWSQLDSTDYTPVYSIQTMQQNNGEFIIYEPCRLTIVTMPTPPPFTIQFTNAGNGSIKNIDGPQTFTFRASEITGGTVNFKMENVRLISAKMTPPPAPAAPEYKLPIAMPSNCKSIDWTKNPAVASGLSISGVKSNYQDAQKAHVLNTTLCAPDISESINDPIHYGDYFYLVEEFGSKPFKLKGDPYVISGLCMKYVERNRNNTTSATAKLSMAPYDSTYNDMCAMLMTCCTKPINAALSQGVDKWQPDATTSPTDAVQKITTAVMNKLKDKYGNNLLIYVIKYRKQTSYISPIDATQKNCDYSVVDACATAKNKTYLYDINTPEELKTALQEIAQDIKTKAGYQDATFDE